MSDAIKEARDLLALRTPGEWAMDDPDGDRDWIETVPERKRHEFGRVWEIRIPCTRNGVEHLYATVPSFNEHDARLMVAAPRLIEALLAEIERLQADSTRERALAHRCGARLSNALAAEPVAYERGLRRGLAIAREHEESWTVDWPAAYAQMEREIEEEAKR